MRNDLEVSESIEINAGPSKVWESLTNPEIIKEYLFGTNTKTDWKKGSEIIFEGEYQGKKYRDKGVIKEILPEKNLTYTYWSGFSGLEDKPENYSLITYTVEKNGAGKTRFTWKQKGFGDENGYEHSKNGMKGLLEQIKKISER